LVSDGTVRTVADEPGGARDASPLAIGCDAVPEVSALGRVPHAPPALLVESLVARGASGAMGRAKIPVDSPFAEAGSAPSYLGLEIAAQTAALVEALGREGDDEAPRVGYLVAIRRARCFVRSLPAGVPLDVVIGFAGSAPPLSVYEIRVEKEGTAMVEGTISTWIAAEAAEGEP
jgi:predicted hotdog family 3-hydroxylacyl-ACP dehydratase